MSYFKLHKLFFLLGVNEMFLVFYPANIRLNQVVRSVMMNETL